MATGQNINTTINSIPDEETADPFLDWISLLQSQGDECAYVHSISYGAVEKYIPEDVQMTLDYEFQKLAIAGRTVLIASGDDGARCSQDETSFEPGKFIHDNDVTKIIHTNTCSNSFRCKPSHSKEWPTSSPYVTSVGATKPSNRNIYWKNFSLHGAEVVFQMLILAQVIKTMQWLPTSRNHTFPLRNISILTEELIQIFQRMV